MTIKGRADDSFSEAERETFRAQATDALEQFTLADRELASSFETKLITASSVLEAWATMHAPVCRDLDALRVNATFRSYLIRNVQFSEHEAQTAIYKLIADRKDALLEEVLNTIYKPGHNERQRLAAEAFLAQPEVEISGFMDRYTAFVEATATADKHAVLLCDPHSGWLDRQRMALQIHKERQQLGQNEDHRLEEIDAAMLALEVDQTSLLGRITNNSWNFVTILDLYRTYKKRLDALSSADKANPSKRLKLFERVTDDFRDNETERIAKLHEATSLKAVRAIREDVYDLLLEVFDLSTAQRNQLLIDVQRYTKIRQERDLILLIQRNRQQFLSHEKS